MDGARVVAECTQHATGRRPRATGGGRRGEAGPPRTLCLHVYDNCRPALTNDVTRILLRQPVNE